MTAGVVVPSLPRFRVAKASEILSIAAILEKVVRARTGNRVSGSEGHVRLTVGAGCDGHGGGLFLLAWAPGERERLVREGGGKEAVKVRGEGAS